MATKRTETKSLRIPSPNGLTSSDLEASDPTRDFVDATSARPPAPDPGRASSIRDLGNVGAEERATRGLTIRFTQRELDLLGRVAKRQERSKHFIARRYVTEALEADVSDRAHLLGLIQLQHPEKTKPALMAEAIDYLFAKYGTPGSCRVG